MQTIVRVHTDGKTVDLGPYPDNFDVKALARDCAHYGVWVDDFKLYPAHRVLYVELMPGPPEPPKNGTVKR